MNTDSGPVLTNRVIGGPEAERLLLVDDEEVVRLALVRYLTRRGYVVDAAPDAADALSRVERGRYALMLCDIRMPGMSGLQLVPKARAIDPDLAVVMLSATTDVPTAAEALGLGAMDYLTKPVDLEDLAAALDRANRRRRFALEQRNVERLLQAESTRLTRQHALELEALADGGVHALTRIVELLETHHPAPARNSRRLAAVAGAVAAAIGLSPSRVSQIRGAGHLATLGRLVAPRGAGEDGSLARTLDILSGLTSLADLVEAVRDQGERWDGTGTPRGVRGDGISLGGRVLAASRAFTDLTSPRGAGRALSAEEALATLARESGVGLDPGVCEALTRVVHDRHLLGFDAEMIERPARGK